MPAHHHTDSKTLRKEREKKIALGHKADDHEDEQNWSRPCEVCYFYCPN